MLLCLLLVIGAPAVSTGYDLPALPTEWRSTAGDDPSWADPDLDDTAWRTVPVLAGWDEQGYAGTDGFLWFRVRVTLDEQGLALARVDQLGIALGPCRYGGYQLYAGGELVGQSRDWSRNLPAPAASVLLIPGDAVSDDGSLVLALRVRRVGWLSDHLPPASVISRYLQLGSYQLLDDQLELQRSRALLSDLTLLILAILYAIAGAYHSLLFLHRRQQVEHCWFGLLALCFSANTLAISSWIDTLTSSYELILRLGDCSGHLATVCAIQFLWSFFRQPIGRVLRAYQLSHAVLALLVALWPNVSFTIASSSPRFLWLLPLLIWAPVLLVSKAWRGDIEARTIVAGGLVLVAVELWELLRTVLELSWNSPIPLPPLGFAAVFVCMGFSLSNRFRRVHEELDQLRVSLENKVRKRTLALEKAKEEAEAASRIKSQFLANMSHEIRTPMTAVIGGADLLMADSELSSRQRAAAETIRSSAKTLLALINDLLDLSKVESGGMEISSSPFELREVVRDSLDLVRPMARKKGLHLELKLDSDVPRVIIGNGMRTGQILVNLLSNAVKFTRQGEIRVSVSSRSLGDGRCEIHLAVQDTGIGIPPEEIAQLFNPFHQVDPSLTREQSGTGLGLAISKRLVELLGGRIWVESTVGVGSTFHCTIIAAEATGVSALPTEPETSDEETAELSVTKGELHILLAEDNEVSQDVITQILEMLGCRVEVAGTGRQAVDALERRPFDVVLMDVQMPEMSGLDAVRLIRANSSLQPQPYIIALTGHATAEDRRACLDAGMNEYLSKPVQVQALKAALARAGTAISEGGSPPAERKHRESDSGH